MSTTASAPAPPGPAANAPRRPRWLRHARSAGAWGVGQLRQARRTPVTLSFLALVWVLAVVTGSLLSGPTDPTDADGVPTDGLFSHVAVGLPSLQQGRWWTVLTSSLFAADLVTYLLASALLLVVGVIVERRWGSLRTAGVAVLTVLLGVGAGLGVIALAGTVESWSWAQLLATSVEVGLTPLVVGLLMAHSAGQTALWRHRVRLGVMAACLVMVLYGGQVEDVLRLSTAAAGWVVGVTVLRRFRAASTTARVRTSYRETRVLVAVVLVASALGPALLAFSPASDGPFAAQAYVYVGPSALHIDTPRNISDFLFALLPALLVISAALGLRRGRRAAWWSAIVLHVLLLLTGANFMAEFLGFAADNLTDADLDGYNLYAGLGPMVVVPLLVIVLLVATRRSFGVRAPRGTYRRLAATVLGALAVLFVLFVAVGTLIADQFDPVPTFGQLLLDFPLRLLPNGYAFIITPDFEPVTGLARFLTDWVGILAWAVVLFGLLRSFVRSESVVRDEDTARARAVLADHGTTSLSWLTTWDGNTYWFADDGRAFVAYRVEGGVAITTGDPVAPPGELAATIAGFLAFCARQGWTPCFYSTTQAVKDVTDQLSWASLQVAEETVLPLGSLAFTGKKFQDIRTSISRAAKAGITAEWIVYPEAPLSLRDQIQAISEEWVADKALPEMGFTLGGLDELKDPAVRCLLAVDADRTVHGITSWMPVHRDGAVVGWTLDFMRRRSDGQSKGVMEFLIGSAALDLQQEGAEFLSLSGAPLAQAEPGAHTSGVQRVLEVIGKTMEPVYGFRSLLRFKAKFQPVYRPMFLCYPETAVLPRIGLGISHAYLPNMTVREAVRMMGQLS
ncbi:DUF2156 domain-containing protein [Nakamurella flavida]|uniref:DUF2156 domain-containing protein n=1 Tax=Nakamurella flavida TaxID=363630 RepID=A0A939C289_9ACTN|nr:DUF2156 domain-containing protein [Nakamurella flavida]MBM9478483.1 DUF2156 domain-containing protein [Nakamurella flavida]MDP9777691.1 lysylphosphatidylglycerol synthetase-like protein (DUF2156 family) [Nakamurella flavida]